MKQLILIIVLHTCLSAASFDCNMKHYNEQSGIRAAFSKDILTITWDGDNGNELRMRLTIAEGMPLIKQLSRRSTKGNWKVIAENIMPEIRIVSGIRRVTQQQTEPLKQLAVPLTADKLNEIKWDAFWDAPLYLDDKPPLSHQSSIPAAEPYANHPGMPRKEDEVVRARATFASDSCEVRTNGARIEVIFNNVKAGIFAGYLQYDFFKDSNLIRQTLVAKTDQPSAAFKYDSGLKGVAIGKNGKIVWRDLTHNWQNYKFGGFFNKKPVILFSSNRLLAAELDEGSIAAFPAPHSFYWARESEQNLGYGWYRKDDSISFSFGIRQAENELDPEFFHNFALYSARPGRWQHMPLFLYISPGSGTDAIEGALAFTHGDRFKAIPGYKVMGHHYHVGLVKRLNKLGGLDNRLNDIETMKSIGVDIFSIIDGARGPGRKDSGELFLQDLADYYEAARSQSDKDFLVMPSDENSTGGRRPFLGGHYDIIPSKPIFWRPQRQPGQPLMEQHPDYGKVYNLGEPMDMMRMAEKENVLISMPHPNSKRSTGYPEAIKDEAQFLHPNYFGLGYRWGMGIDASEIRLGEYRFLTLWDKVNNWMTARGLPPKFAIAISEARSDLGDRGKPPYDDAYGMAPVNYLKIDKVPAIDDMSTIVNALKLGNYFVTSGEVLITNFIIEAEGNTGTIGADVEWTFPLEFIEVVWGDGEKTDRRIISTTDLAAFGQKRFEIPFKINGKKWIRFAAWDIASNGALLQPVSLP